jgi:hypothetical protein
MSTDLRYIPQCQISRKPFKMFQILFTAKTELFQRAFKNTLGGASYLIKHADNFIFK